MELETGQATVMEIKKENVRELSQLLKTIIFKDFGTLHPYDSGLKITVDDGACQQANAYLSSSFFSSFLVREEDINLKVPMKTLYEVLSIPEGHSNSVKFSYCGMFEPLKLMIEEAESDGCVIRAKINCALPEQDLDFEFQDTNVLATYMLRTQVLKEIFKDFDDSCKTVKMQFTKTALCFTTNGEVSIPSRSVQMETVKCTEEVAFSYILSLLQRMNLAINLASKVVIRVDERGVLCCQFTIDHGEDRKSYIEFLTVPTQEENDD
uniref:Cell cycle checkpoint protein RAD1 n=1 Tax=Caenorhabditis japonica TaxID=281687 RepID=A0A8R1I0F1_CAEJA